MSPRVADRVDALARSPSPNFRHGRSRIKALSIPAVQSKCTDMPWMQCHARKQPVNSAESSHSRHRVVGCALWPASTDTQHNSWRRARTSGGRQAHGSPQPPGPHTSLPSTTRVLVVHSPPSTQHVHAFITAWLSPSKRSYFFVETDNETWASPGFRPDSRQSRWVWNFGMFDHLREKRKRKDCFQMKCHVED